MHFDYKKYLSRHLLGLFSTKFIYLREEKKNWWDQNQGPQHGVSLPYLLEMSILFDCVRRAGPPEAELLSEILPQVEISFSINWKDRSIRIRVFMCMNDAGVVSWQGLSSFP